MVGESHLHVATCAVIISGCASRSAVGSGPSRFERVGVVVPAHDEQSLLPDCLGALRVAAVRVLVAVHLLVVVDACTDRSAEVVEAAGFVAALAVWERSVGAARRAGFSRLLHELGPEGTWLASIGLG